MRQLDFWYIEFGAGEIVRIVGESSKRDVGDHLQDLLVAVPGLTRPVEGFVGRVTPGLDDLADEPQARRAPGVLGLEALRLPDLLFA